MTDNTTRKNNTFWLKFLSIAVTILLSVIAVVYGYGQLNSAVQTNTQVIAKNCKEIEANSEAAVNIRIQQGKMDTKLEYIKEGIEEIKQEVKK